MALCTNMHGEGACGHVTSGMDICVHGNRCCVKLLIEFYTSTDSPGLFSNFNKNVLASVMRECMAFPQPVPHRHLEEYPWDEMWWKLDVSPDDVVTCVTGSDHGDEVDVERITGVSTVRLCGEFITMVLRRGDVVIGPRGPNVRMSNYPTPHAEFGTVVSTVNNAAGIEHDGSVHMWGCAFSKANEEFRTPRVIENLRRMRPVLQLVSSRYAFAALGTNGVLTTWGDKDWGGAHTLSNVKCVVAAPHDFAVRFNDGSVRVLGRGGCLPDRQVALGNTTYQLQSARRLLRERVQMLL